MKRVWFVAVPALLAGVLFLARGSGLTAQQPAAAPSPQPAPAPAAVPEIPFDSSTDFLKYSPDMNFGEVLGVAINSKSHLVVLNHPGSATQGPLYGNASTQLLEFDCDRQVRSRDRQERLRPRLRPRHPLRQVRQPLGRRQGHERRHAVQSRRLRHDEPGPPAGRAGRSRGVLVPRRARRRAAAAQPTATSGGPTDIAWDSDDNIYISDGYTQLARRQVRQARQLGEVVGLARTGGAHANQNPGQFNTPHNIARRPPEQRLRRRSQQPPHPGVRYATATSSGSSS